MTGPRTFASDEDRENWQTDTLHALTERQFSIEDYVGPTGDGVADDRTSVNDAIAAASAAGGGTVIGRAGAVYGVSASVAAASNVLLSGVKLKDITGNQSIIDRSGVTNFHTRRCEFTGSGTLGTAGRGAVWGTGSIRCTDMYNLIDTVGTCGIVYDAGVQCWAFGNIIRRPVEHGVYIAGASVDCHADRNLIDEAGFGGVSTVCGVKIAGTATRCAADDNTILAALAEGLLFESGIMSCWGKRNVVRGCGNMGIRVLAGADDIDIGDNTVLDNTIEGIRAQGGSRVRISGNRVRSSTRSCIRVDSGTADFLVEGNYVVQTGGFYSFDITGTNHVIGGNYSQATGADAGIVIRATSTGCVVRADNHSPGGVTNSAGAGAKVLTSGGDIAAATTLGSVVFRRAEYDGAGLFVGYTAIYNTIT